MIIEACVESVSQSIKAWENGAHRLELCSHLEVGGLTPSEPLLLEVLEKVPLPVMMMIRPIAGDFILRPGELQTMLDQIDFGKKAGVYGFVFGLLTRSGNVDLTTIKKLAERAHPLPCTFHKAIDLCPNPFEAIQEIKNISNITRILTSGQAVTAWEGRNVLRKMIGLAQPEIRIVVAGKVTNENINDLHQSLRAKEYHGRKIVGLLD